jgi:hypothetical protein
MKTLTELRTHVKTRLRCVDGYEHKQIFEMIDLFENGLQDEVDKLNQLYRDQPLNLYIIARIETLNKILQ